MYGVGRMLFQFHKQLHTFSFDRPSETLKRKFAGLENIRKRKNPKKDQLFVEVPESKKYLDTPTMPLILTAVGVVIFAKVLMLIDDSRSQEMIERKIKNAPAGQATVRMLTREEWGGIQEVRPQTSFESKIVCSNARIQTAEPLHREDLKDWTIDVLADALTRAEENVKHDSHKMMA